MSNAGVIHPKCGKRFPGTVRFGHCSVCCETFVGLGAFEAHRVGEHGVDRRCELKPYRSYTKEYPHTEVFGHWQDDKGFWHYGERLTPEQREKLWGKADD